MHSFRFPDVFIGGGEHAVSIFERYCLVSLAQFFGLLFPPNYAIIRVQVHNLYPLSWLMIADTFIIP